MISVENEVNKHKNCKDRDELIRHINDYKGLALQSANNLTMAGQYNMVALKLQEICDKLPAPRFKNLAANSKSDVPTKTAKISKEEKAKINAAWNKKAGGR